MNIIKKFGGDLNTCIKCYKDFAFNQANKMSTEDGRVFSTLLNGNDSQGKSIKIYVKILIDLPDCHLTIMTMPFQGGGNLSSGLSINEIHDVKFKQFYPRDGSGFQDYLPLFKNSQLNNDLPYFYTYNSKNVNQNHYINGSQFTGILAEQVQQQLGTTDIDIKYKSLWSHTNGIYRDSKDNYWLITIKNGGVYAREVSTSKYTDSVIKTVNSSTKTVSSNLLDGNGFLDTDTLILSFTQFYSNSFALSQNQGWSFNKKGNKIQNINFKYELTDRKLTSFRYEILITETNIDNKITLQATYNIVETGFINLHNFLSFMSPIYNDYNNYSTEQVHNFNYSQVKYNPLGQIDLDYTTIDGIIDPYNTGIKEFKIPLQCYFDENDKIKVVYYYMKAERYETATTSTSGYTQDSDFINGIFTKLGDLSTGYSNNTNYALNNTLKHGIIINEDESLLVNDNLGERIHLRKVELLSGNTKTDFSYKVINNLLPVNLNPYETFDIGSLFDFFNSKVESFQGNYNNFYDIYYNTKFVNKDNLLISDDYVLDKQFAEINNMLSMDERFTQIDNIHSLIELKKINKLNFKNIELPYLLYELDENILPLFQNINSTYRDDIYSKLDNINNQLNTYMQSVYVNYYNSIRINYKNLFNYFRNIKDKKTLNVSYVNSLILDINTNHVPVINSMIDSLNSIITSLNTDIDSILEFSNNVLFYNNLVEQFNTNLKAYHGIYLEYLTDVVVSTNVTDQYYLGKKVYYYKEIEKIYYKNRKLTNFSLIFNNGNRNSLSIYSQKNTYNDIINMADYIENVKLASSNEYALYKQSRTYVPGSGIDPTYGDFELVDTFKNRKEYHITDMGGNDILIVAGENYSFLGSFMDDTLCFHEDNINSSTPYYKNIYNIANFETIPKDTVKYHDSVMRFNISKDYTEYQPVIENKIKTISKEVISQDSLIKNDYRLIHLKSNNYYNDFIINSYKFDRKYTNQLYFNMLKDANSFSYVISKDLYNANDSKLTLTNISKYTIMNYQYVNFIGQAFDKE